MLTSSTKECHQRHYISRTPGPSSLPYDQKKRAKTVDEIFLTNKKITVRTY